MNEEHPEDLTQLRGELARLTEEVAALTRSLQQDTGDDAARPRTTAGEALVGAELLTARELVQVFGWTRQTLCDMQALTRRQFRLALDDHGRTWRDFSAAPGRPGAALRSHVQRRATHLLEGVGESGQVLTRDAQRLTTLVVELWRPFVTLLRERGPTTDRTSR